jgi:hypothetical protein
MKFGKRKSFWRDFWGAPPPTWLCQICGQVRRAVTRLGLGSRAIDPRRPRPRVLLRGR